MYLQQFLTTFTDLVDQLDKILPEEKNNIIKCKLYLRLTNDEVILNEFLSITKPFKEKILNKDETFIQSIQSEYEILKAYNKINKNNKDKVLDYIQILYLYAANHERK